MLRKRTILEVVTGLAFYIIAAGVLFPLAFRRTKRSSVRRHELFGSEIVRSVFVGGVVLSG